MAYGNAYTTADLTNQFPAGRSAILWLQHNSLTAVTLTGCSGAGNIDLSSNNLNQSAVDGVLATVASWGTSGGTLNLSSNAAPSSAGTANQTTLVGRGWTVTVDSSGGNNPAGVLSDDFQRTNATGIANVGNGWAASSGADANIVNGDLIALGSGAYRRILNPAAGLLPANYSVTVNIPGATVGTYFGLVGRWNGSNGVRVMFTSNSTTLSIGDASGFMSNDVSHSTPTFPASWSNTSIDHTVTMHMNGTTITLEIDGQTVTTATVTTNAAATGTGYGICGEGQGRALHSIGTTQP
jgi:hypothetical protein